MTKDEQRRIVSKYLRREGVYFSHHLVFLLGAFALMMAIDMIWPSDYISQTYWSGFIIGALGLRLAHWLDYKHTFDKLYDFWRNE